MSRWRHALASLLAVTTVATVPVVVGVAGAPVAAAVVGSQFQAGSIISDSVFYDSGAMTADQVQVFLRERGSSCRSSADTSCLKDYTTATPARPAERGLCAGYAASGLESAGQIIANVARSCGVSPRSLLVLMEKESSIVSRTTPSATAYRSATGFGCPDTAACDATYYGFFNQVYMAARQFKVYAANPTRYGYQAGRVNSILFNPNTACGRADVYIANQATAGLYTYTPYQPNSAALANLYGTGDGCSAYGNRNFWRIFNDWFGDTQTGSFLLRTAADPTVFLVSGQNRYAVPDLDALSALGPLGKVGVVSTEYLSGFTEGRVLGRFLRGPDGAVYFVDGGVLRQAPTCAMVADFGDDCPRTVPVSAVQVAAFTRGGLLTHRVAVPGGAEYQVTAGSRRELFDAQSAAAAGVGTATTSVTAAAVAGLRAGPPIIRDDVLAVSRTDASVWLSNGGRLTRVPSTVNSETSWSRGLSPRLLDASSIAAAPRDPDFHGFARDVTGARTYLVTADSRYLLEDPARWTTAPAVFSDSLLGSLRDGGSLRSPGHLRTAGSPTVYRVEAGRARPVTTYDALLATNGGAVPPVVVATADTLAALTPGSPVLAPGSLALTSDGALHVVDGAARLVYLPTFPTAATLGLPGGYRSLPDAADYVRDGSALSTVVRCGATVLLGARGTVTPVRAPVPAAMPVTTLGTAVCATLRTSTSPPVTTELFGRAEGSATVYRLTTTGKQPVATYDRLLTLSGGAQPVIAVLAPGVLDRVPTGPPA